MEDKTFYVPFDNNIAHGYPRSLEYITVKGSEYIINCKKKSKVSYTWTFRPLYFLVRIKMRSQISNNEKLLITSSSTMQSSSQEYYCYLIVYVVEFWEDFFCLYYRCISWKTSTKPVHERTCKHLQNWLGEDYEMYRIGKTTGSASDEAITRAAKYKAVSLMLAHKWTEDVNPKGISIELSSHWVFLSVQFKINVNCKPCEYFLVDKYTLRYMHVQCFVLCTGALSYAEICLIRQLKMFWIFYWSGYL